MNFLIENIFIYVYFMNKSTIFLKKDIISKFKTNLKFNLKTKLKQKMQNKANALIIVDI